MAWKDLELCSRRKPQAGGDKNILQGETTALFGLISYPVQDDQSHDEML